MWSVPLRANNEYQNNAVAKKMIVTERDPAKMRVRAKIEDEDGIETYWLDILSSSSSTTKSFNMPDEGDQIWAMIDAKGEEGFVAGSRYNDVDTPPFNTNDDLGSTGDGWSIHVNKSNGDMTISTPGTVKITASKIILIGTVELGAEGGPAVARIGDTTSDGATIVSGASKVKAV